MKKSLKIDEEKISVRIDPAMNKYDNIVLFPEKLAKAKEQLKESGFPKLPTKRDQ